MEVETTLAKCIRTAEEGVKYDAVCKKILSEKIILAWILHSCVEEFREIDVNEITERYIEGQPQVSEVPVAPDEKAASVISGISTEDSSIHEGKVYYGIRFHALAPKSGELIRRTGRGKLWRDPEAFGCAVLLRDGAGRKEEGVEGGL